MCITKGSTVKQILDKNHGQHKWQLWRPRFFGQKQQHYKILLTKKDVIPKHIPVFLLFLKFNPEFSPEIQPCQAYDSQW